MEKNIIEKNRFALTVIKIIKENIEKHQNPIDNPVSISGLNKRERFKIFSIFFNKEFNNLYKGKYKYISCEKIQIDEEIDINKDLIIIEDIDYLVNNDMLQEKLKDIINRCIENNVQLVLCSNNDTNDLILNEALKSRTKWGISLYLEK